MVPSEERKLLVGDDKETVGGAKIPSLVAQNAARPRWHFFVFFSAVVLSVEVRCNINGIHLGLFICVLS